jgi:hypothetical protein
LLNRNPLSRLRGWCRTRLFRQTIVWQQGYLGNLAKAKHMLMLELSILTALDRAKEDRDVKLVDYYRGARDVLCLILDKEVPDDG